MGRRAHLPSLESRYPDRDALRRAAARTAPKRAAPAVWHELLAGPFERFEDLAAFIKAVRTIPGVERVSTRRFVPGMVRIRVRYAGALPLGAQLEPLRGMAPTVIAGTTRGTG